METVVSYLLVGGGGFHTQVLHATIQLRGETQGTGCHTALPAWHKALGTARYFWGEDCTDHELLCSTGNIPGCNQGPDRDVPRASQSPRQLSLLSDTLPVSPPEDAGRHPSPLPRNTPTRPCQG